MASTKMFTKNAHHANGSSSTFFHHQQQQAPPTSTPANGTMDEDMTLTHEMHVKMAKKIAQLTKVIYTLNTKADEHETIVSNLKQAFEQEKSTLASNASARIDDLLRRVEKLSTIKQTQHSLYENKIQMLESERQSQANELLRVQQASVEREHEIAEDFRLKLGTIKRDINQIKHTYDDRVGDLHREQQQTLDQLRDKHQSEMEKIKDEAQRSFTIEYEAQKKYYLQTIEELKRDHQELLSKQKNQQMTQEELGQEFLNERKRFEEQIQQLEERIEAMQNQSDLALAEERKRLEEKTDQLDRLRNEFERYKLTFNANSDQVTAINEQLIQQRDEYEQLKQKFEKSNREMTTVKERFNRQANELEEKLKLLKEKESNNRQLEGDLLKCQQELQLTVERLRQIEQDQHAQLTESESTTNYLERRIHDLDKTIHQLTVEKQQTMVKYDRELTELRETYEERVKLCREEMQNELERLTEHFQQLSNDEQTRAKTTLQSREQELHQHFEQEKTELRAQWLEEVNRSQSEHQHINQQYRELKDNYTKQIEELRKRLDEQTTDHSNLQKQYRETQSLNEQYQQEIDQLKRNLTEQSRISTQIQVECEQLKKRCHEIELSSSDELKEKIEKLSMELNEKWSKKLKSDCEKIRKEISQQKDEEKHMAIEELRKQTQKDLAVAQRRIEELEQQLHEMQRQLLVEHEKSKEESLSALQNANEDKRRTINEFQMRIQDLTTQLQRLEGKVQEELLEQKLQLEKEHLNQINDLKTRHLEDIRGQQLAYTTHLETVRTDHERVLVVETEKQNVQYQSQLEQLRKEFARTHSNDLEEKDRGHAKELAAIRLQLDRALEITKIKEREADLRIEDLTSDLNIKQTRIDQCLRDLSELQEQVESFREEIDQRNKEMQRVRNEAQKEMKHREERFHQEQDDKLRELKKIHDQEQKQLLEEFSKAHELLKIRVNDLQSKLSEAEDRYRNRESRDEDLELITTLQQTIASYQEQLKKIHDEKKYLKMELVNRETNFNKVFTNAPSSNVGVMNPLSFNTKFVPRNMDGAVPSRLKSQSPRPSKLEPLASNGEVPHELSLNPNKPLLPKRFMK